MRRLSLVTGAAIGIGNEIAISLAHHGDHVVLIDVDKTALASAVANLHKLSLCATALTVDLESPHLAAKINQMLRATPNIEWIGLVNCASQRTRNDLTSETRESWMSQLAVGSWAPFVLSRAVVEAAIRLNIHGRIVNITSPSSRLVSNQSPSYHVAKAGLEALTRYLAVHAARLGAQVTVNAVEPGLIVQERHKGRYQEASSATWRAVCEQYLPSGSVGSQRDVAEVVSWLLSPEARFVNGATLVVDGGGTVQDQLFLLHSRVVDATAGND